MVGRQAPGGAGRPVAQPALKVVIACVCGSKSIAKNRHTVPCLQARSPAPCPAATRRAPKVTVTRDGVSLCQKGVTPWLLFVVNYFLASKRAKTSRGAGLRAPQHAPPCGRRRTRSHGGGAGGRSGEQSYSPWPVALRSIGFGCA